MYRLSSRLLLGFVALKQNIKVAASSLRHSRQKQLKTRLKADSWWKLQLGIHGNVVGSRSPLGVRAISESQCKSFLWGQTTLQSPPHCEERRQL